MLSLSLCRIYIYVLENNQQKRRRTIGLAVHDDGGPALRVGGALLHRSDRTFPDVVRLGGEAGARRAERGGRGQEAGSNDGGGELHCCRVGWLWVVTVIKEYGDGWESGWVPREEAEEKHGEAQGGKVNDAKQRNAVGIRHLRA